MIIYRLEKDGNGPYTNNILKRINKDLHTNLVYCHGMGNRHVALVPCLEDANSNLLSNYRLSKLYCGCDSLDNLEDWFDGFLEDILKSGFKINRYSCPDKYCAIGKYGQVVFVMEKAVGLL